MCEERATISNGILGILDLEPGSDPNGSLVSGSLQDSSIFTFPAIRETVSGAWADVVVRGDPSLEGPYIAAAKCLVGRGATAITADCGFSIRHQAAIAAAVPVPVAVSALLLTSMIVRQLSGGAKLAVLTFDSTHFGTELLGLSDPCDISRVVVSGIENTPTWQNEMKRPPVRTELSVLREDVCSRVEQLREKHPEIKALLLECTMFPRIARSLRRSTGLPVYDVTTLGRMLMESVAPRSYARLGSKPWS
ncbi:hypothetical protein CUJ84_pRLN3000314 (plasmid) [Rhizobium leguminosarum]|uniref:Aspartate/glutamate racemase family protein n=1 Tax=Rhizobium leguminosarum TaxID=384 RepID=A0A2K9ZGU2_RHILE|nr:hypothetical protein CUJ84_pRLN3000314 [Rhizobium leguminosarum]